MSNTIPAVCFLDRGSLASALVAASQAEAIATDQVSGAPGSDQRLGVEATVSIEQDCSDPAPGLRILFSGFDPFEQVTARLERYGENGELVLVGAVRVGMDASGAWEAPRIGTAGPGTFVVTVERDGKEPFSVSKFVRCHLSPPVISELRVTPSRFPINQYSPVRINLSVSRYSFVRFWVRRAEPPRKGLAPPNESRSFKLAVGGGLHCLVNDPLSCPGRSFGYFLHDLPLRPGRYTLTARARGFARSKPSERVSTTFQIMRYRS